MKRLILRFVTGFLVLAIGGVVLWTGFNSASATHKDTPACTGQQTQDCLQDTTATVVEATEDKSSRSNGATVLLRVSDGSSANVHITEKGSEVMVGDQLAIRVLNGKIVAVQVQEETIYTNKEPSMPLVIAGIAVMIAGFLMMAFAYPAIYDERQRKLRILFKK